MNKQDISVLMDVIEEEYNELYNQLTYSTNKQYITTAKSQALQVIDSILCKQYGVYTIQSGSEDRILLCTYESNLYTVDEIDNFIRISIERLYRDIKTSKWTVEEKSKDVEYNIWSLFLNQCRKRIDEDTKQRQTCCQ